MRKSFEELIQILHDFQEASEAAGTLEFYDYNEEEDTFVLKQLDTPRQLHFAPSYTNLQGGF